MDDGSHGQSPIPEGAIRQPQGGWLLPFKPGQSGHPGGIPKGYVPYATAAGIVGELPLADVQGIAKGKFPKGWSRSQSIQYVFAARSLVAALLSGKEHLDRVEGPVASKTELSGPGGGALELLQIAPAPATERGGGKDGSGG